MKVEGLQEGLGENPKHRWSGELGLRMELGCFGCRDKESELC